MNTQMQGKQAPAVLDSMLHEKLVDRRQRLEITNSRNGFDPDVARLLREVDDALQRFANGTYGLCEECHEPIEPERLLADPLMRVCLGDLNARQRQALEQDLQLAAEIQKGLLPSAARATDAWRIDYVYHPAGIVSGDYVDVIRQGNHLYFILGDVSGKGMGASLLMSSLHAMFNSLVPIGLPLCDLMSRANRLLCESSLANQFATLVAGRASIDGEVEICNAGHLPPIVVKKDGYHEIDSTGLPLGMFCDVKFESSVTKFDSGDTLLLFSDGVTEAADITGREFGTERLVSTVNSIADLEPSTLVRNCFNAVERFRAPAARTDDLTIMALKFTGAAN